VLPPSKFLPRRYKPHTVGEWTGHLAFANDLIAALEPRLIVELGTHWGEAYFTFCQSVQELGLGTMCYAVDHWQGDEHAGSYGEEVFDEVSTYNGRFYRQFSYLLRRSFDDAINQFGDGSIDLLHIDGLHTYEAVRHDFEKWLPKVKPGGIVLFHDISPRHEDFGVWRLWEEIKAQFPETFEFHHSWGLGVVRKKGGGSLSPFLHLLFKGSPEQQEQVRRQYVIYASHLEHVLGPGAAAAAPSLDPELDLRAQVFPLVNGAYSEEASQVRKIAPGDWQTVVFELRDPEIKGPIRFDPCNMPAIVEVGDISIHSIANGEMLWSSTASAEKREFRVEGTARAHPRNSSALISGGDDPIIILNTPPTLPGPIKITIALKVTAGLPFIDAMSRIVGELSEADRRRTRQTKELQETRDRLATELGRTKDELYQVRTALTSERAHTAGILNSLSWRVTAPVRAVMKALRGGKPDSNQAG
jgi:hypothetical protein